MTGKLSAVVTVTDYDGDTVSQTTDIGDNIQFRDDGPKLIGHVTSNLSLNENDLPSGNDANKEALSASGALHIDLGADGGHIALAAEGANWNSETHTLTASDGAWTVTLNSNGTYTFTLLDNTLLHGPANNGTNTLSVPVTYTATDGDGDTISGAFTVKIVDDAPQLVDTETRTVDEGDIATLWSVGSSPNDGAGDGSETGGPLASFLSGLFGFSVGGPAYISGSVAATVAFGADGAHAGGGFSYAADAIATMENLGLTSKGGTVHYTMVGDTLVGYVEQPGFDRPVVALTLHSDGSYEFRQFDQLDHVSGDEHNLALQTNSGSIDAIDFGALIVATDGDGDHISLAGQFTIAIQDDTPVQIAGRTESGTVEEEQLVGGNEDRSGAGDADIPIPFIGDRTTEVATGNLRSLVNVGADEATTSWSGTRGTFFLGDTSGLPHITSQGQPVSYVVTDGSDSGSLGDKLTAYVDLDGDHQFSTGDRAVFTLTLENNGTSTGDYKFTLLSPIDHAGNGEDSQSLDLSSVIQFSDYDGDPITLSNGTFKIDVIDDIPTVSANAAVVIDDDDVQGAHGNPGGTGDRSPAHVDGTLAHSYGADGAGTVKLLDSGAPAGFHYEVDGNVLTISQTVGSVTTDVIKVTLSDDTSGHYTVEQLAPIHHASGSNENDQPFTISYQVTDKDGDHAATNGTLSITVNDDTPLAGLGEAKSVSEHDLTTQAAFDQSFESATDAASAGLVDGGDYGHLTIKASGDDGIVTKTPGGHYALVTQTDSGPYTRFGGYDSTFDDGFRTSVDIYLDPNNIQPHEGFDYSVAISKADGSHLRDFIFHVGEDSQGHLYISANNNTDYNPLTDAEWTATASKASVGSAGWYTFSQSFHDDGTGHLAVDFVVRDASGAVVFSQTINSGDPIADTGGHRYGWFTNVDVADGIAIDNVTLTQHDDSSSATSVSGSLHIDAGADGVASLGFHGIVEGGAVKDSSNNAVTSDHQAVTYHVVDAHTIEGVTASGQVIFTVTLDPVAGTYNFVLQNEIDHPTQGADTLALNLGFVVTDGDGDSASSSFTVTINDDVPTASWLGAQAVTENSAADGTFIESVSSGTLKFDPGADGGKITAIDYRFNASIMERGEGDSDPQSFPALTSHGTPVHINTTVDASANGGEGSIILTGTTTDGHPVFTLVVNQTTGAYTYTLLGPIDHPDLNQGGADDALTMVFDFQVTDGDGDTTAAFNQGILQIDIRDDVPVIDGHIATANLLTNGDFTGGTFAHQESWGQWATEDTGWRIDGTAPDQSGVQLERIDDGYGACIHQTVPRWSIWVQPQQCCDHANTDRPNRWPGLYAQLRDGFAWISRP